MPERRIDAIGKADAASWSSVSLPKGGANMLRVLSGQLSHVKVGEIMHALVQKAGNGAFQVKLNGETFTFKGLPASLAGREVAFFVRKASLKGSGKSELFWIGPSRTVQAAMAAAGQARHSAKIHSQMPAGLKAGMTVSAQVERATDGTMHLTASIVDAKEGGKPFRLRTALIDGVRAGQQIQARILQAADSGYRMELISTSPRMPTPDPQSPQPARETAPTMANFRLAAGETTLASVRERLPGGNVLLHIAGADVEAPAPASVQAGDMLTLRMQKPPAGFQLLSIQKGVADSAISTLRSTLPSAAGSLSGNLAAIRNLIPMIAAGGLPETLIAQLDSWIDGATVDHTRPIDGARLAQMIRDSGVVMEPKLAAAIQGAAHALPTGDLKALLLQLSALAEGGARHIDAMRQLAELGHQGASRVEAHQSLNLLAAMHGDPLRLELPMFVAGQPVNVQLSIQQQGDDDSTRDGNSAASNSSYSVLFALELSGLGRMQVDARISETSVHARIHSDRLEASRFLGEHLQRLESRLQDMGYSEVWLLPTRSEPVPEKQRQFEQLRNLAPSKSQLLDLRV